MDLPISPLFYKETSGFTTTKNAPEESSTATPDQKKQLEEKGSMLVGFLCVSPRVDYVRVFLWAQWDPLGSLLREVADNYILRIVVKGSCHGCSFL